MKLRVVVAAVVMLVCAVSGAHGRGRTSSHSSRSYSASGRRSYRANSYSSNRRYAGSETRRYTYSTRRAYTSSPRRSQTGRYTTRTHSPRLSYGPRRSYTSAPRQSYTRRTARSYSYVRTPRASTCVGCVRDRDGRIKRSAAARRDFMRAHPCPSTGRRSGACPGYVVDHVTALACGGPDAPSNMQWQTTAAARQKDKTERRCR